VGETIKFSNNFSKIVISEKGNKEFQVSLTDEKELVQLSNSYDSLINLIQENEEVNNILGLKTRRLRDGKAKLFDKKYEIFDILINDGEQFDKLKLNKEREGLIILEQQTRIQIQKLENHLKELIGFAKDKLRSKKWSAEEREKRGKEREILLQKFLHDQEGALTTSEKELLERKLTKKELESLCQVQKELTKAQKELDDLLKKEQLYQAQVGVSPK
ncbi:607_t:CDS:2, partial [Ambispora gerdemannii]